MQRGRPAAMITLSAAAAVGAVAGVAWSGPRSTTWPFVATVDDLIGWSSTQSTATTVGQVLVVVTAALAAGLRVPTRIAPWAFTAVLVVLVAFTKVAVPEAASLSVFSALHIVKVCAAGIGVGLVLHATRQSSAGWVALATGVFGGALAASIGTTAPATGAFVATRLDSTSVFGEPAWWLLASSFVLCVAAAVVHRPRAESDAPSAREWVRLSVYAVLVALVCRVGVEVVDGSLWVAVPVLLIAFVVVDRVAARWEPADARTVLIAVLIAASTVAMWNANARTPVDARVLTVVAVAGLAAGALAAWRLPVGRRTSWGAAVLLAALPVVVTLVDEGAVGTAGLGIVAALVPLALTAVAPDGAHMSVRPLAVSLPGLAILFAAAAPPAALVANVEAIGQMLEIAGPGAGLGVTLESHPVDHTSAYLLLAVAAACTLRIVRLSRRAA